MKSSIKRGTYLGRLIQILALLLAVLLAPTTVQAEQTLADGDWFERELGSGVVWRYYLFDDLYGNRESVSYIDADLSNPNVAVEFPYVAASRQKISSMAPGQFPQSKAAINGTYFVTTGSGGHATYLRVNNVEIPDGGGQFSPWGYEGAITLTNAGAANITKIPGGGWSSDVTHPDILACGPIVTFNGVVPTASLDAIGAHCTSRHPRSAVGITSNNHLILFAVDGRSAMTDGMTCDELGRAMLELGCDNAMNLDGGGSTALWGAGEQYNGVLNYPTDNGKFDHLGERACSNAISIVSTPPVAAQWDARLTAKNFVTYMANGSAQTVQLQYTNIGTGTWTAANTKLVLARPDNRISVFQDASWVTASQPAVMSPSVVAPGQTANFSFTLQSPTLALSAAFTENFKLTQSGVGRIGPADSEAWMNIAVQLPTLPYQDFIVESRPGGQNSAWYTDSGMADTSSDCTATSLTSGIGTRYGSTYRSVAGAKQAVVAPDFPADGFYKVYVAWPAGTLRQSPVTYHVNLAGVDYTKLLDQTATANEWIQLGTGPFFFEKGFSGTVTMTNEGIDVSGNMYAGAVKFEYVPTSTPDKSYDVNYLGSANFKPVIDGQVGGAEWNAAAPAASGYVLHNNSGIAATEDGNFRMLFDDTFLYILFTMADANLPAYPVPPASYGYTDITGDKINFYITPGGVDRQKFYRIMLSPNPTNGQCYVWSQASLTKTTSANVGTDWSQRGGAAYTYSGSQLVVEYKIPWANFNYPGMQYISRPNNGDVWGAQPSLSNNLGLSGTESVNWEPDTTAGFVNGEPFGQLNFVMSATRVVDWSIY